MTSPMSIERESLVVHGVVHGWSAGFPRHVGVTVRAGLCVSVHYSIGQC